MECLNCCYCVFCDLCPVPCNLWPVPCDLWPAFCTCRQATVKVRLYMGNIMYWGLLTLNIISFFSLFSLACASSKTYNLQRVFLRIYDTNWGKSCRAFLAETVETWKKNRCMIEATHVLRRNIKFRAFPKRVGPRILSLQSVDFFGTSEH